MPLLPYPELLMTSQVDGTALTAAARNSAIPAAAVYELPANFFDVIGKMIRIEAWGRISSVITTPGTFRWDVNFLDSAAANAIVFDSLAGNLEDGEAHTTVGWKLQIDMVCRAIGTTGNLMGMGTWSSVDTNDRFALGALSTNEWGGLTALLPWNSAPAVGANFNTTLRQSVDLRFTQTVATGSMTVHMYQLWRLN